MVVASLPCQPSCELFLESGPPDFFHKHSPTSTTTTFGVSALSLAKSQDLTNGGWPASLCVLVALVCAARCEAPAAYWASWANSVGMFRQRQSLLLLPRRSQILPHMLTICKGQRTAEDSFIQWVSRQQSGQRSRMVFAPDNLRSKTLSQEFPLMVGNSLLPGPLRNFVSSSIVPRLCPIPWWACSPWCPPPLLFSFALSSSVFSSFVAYGFPPCLLARTLPAPQALSARMSLPRRSAEENARTAGLSSSRFSTSHCDIVGLKTLSCPLDERLCLTQQSSDGMFLSCSSGLLKALF